MDHLSDKETDLSGEKYPGSVLEVFTKMLALKNTCFSSFTSMCPYADELFQVPQCVHMLMSCLSTLITGRGGGKVPPPLVTHLRDIYTILYLFLFTAYHKYI